jgi:ribosomal protein L11 methyltransferase
MARFLKERRDLQLIDDFHFTYEQWQGERLRSFKVADFEIVPAWERATPTENGLQVFLDPGVVFGNGLHPTTRDCLRALAYAARQRPFEQVLDLGTGTGILALAAARMGAKSVLAIDLNPLCVKTAKNNIVLNRLEEIIRVVEGPAEAFAFEPADLMVANIHWEIIHRLLHEDGFRNRERLLISGLMRSQHSDFRRHLSGNRFRVLHEWDHEMTWFTVLAQRK